MLTSKGALLAHYGFSCVDAAGAACTHAGRDLCVKGMPGRPVITCSRTDTGGVVEVTPELSRACQHLNRCKLHRK